MSDKEKKHADKKAAVVKAKKATGNKDGRREKLSAKEYDKALEKLHAEVMAAHLQADRPGPNEALERALAALRREQDASGAILQISAEHSALQKLWAEQRRTPLPAARRSW